MKKVFIADDDFDILEIIRLMLVSQGYDVHVSANANDIFEMKGKFADLILLDIWMSGIDGRDICRRLQQDINTCKIPIIFVSANSKLPEIAKEFNIYGYIAKPFDMNELIAKVNGVFN